MIWTIFMMLSVSSWDCGLEEESIPGIHSSNSFIRGLSNGPIRISRYLSNFDLGSDSQNAEFEEIWSSVHSLFSRTIQTRSIEGNLILPSSALECGSEIAVPASHRSEGVSSTDLIVYFTTSNAGTLYGGPCVSDSEYLNMPVAGRIVINPEVFNSGTFSEKFASLAHQVTHVLGFIKSHIDTTAGLVISEPLRGSIKNLFAGTMLKEKVRNFFGCVHMEGLEFEDATWTHWDMRVAYNDFMTSQTTIDPIFSEFTFALLHDLGYSVQWEYVDQPVFARQTGCDFYSEKCIVDNQSIFKEFCTDSTQKCDVFHIHEAECDIVDYTDDLPVQFQYFDSPKRGGGNSYMDYCPIMKPIDSGNCRDSSKAYGEIEKARGETACENCRCIGGTLIKSGEGDGSEYHSGCYKLVLCTDTSAVISVGSENVYHTVDCPFTGGQVYVPGYEGYLDCPSSDVLCSAIPCINACSGNGFCLSGKCICDHGKGGADCSVQCDEGCMTCTAEDPLTCVDCFGENQVLNSEGECVCPEGYIANGLDCELFCFSLCESCDTTDPLSCIECIEHASKNESGNCQCDSGYVQFEGTCKVDNFPLLSLHFDQIAQDYTYGDFSVVGNGEIKPAPRMGVLMSTASYFQVEVTTDSLELDRSTHSVSMWVWLSTANEGSLYWEYLPDSSYTLELKITEDHIIMKVNDGNQETSVSLPDLPINQWVKVGYSLKYMTNTEVCVYLNDRKLCSPDVIHKYEDLGDISTAFGKIDGFLLNLKVYYGVIDPDIESTDDLCVNFPDCDIVPMDCQVGFAGDTCAECNCNGEACVRTSDCRLNTDELCETFEKFYNCEECFPGAIMTESGCKCKEYAEFQESTLTCECVNGSSSSGDCNPTFECYVLCTTCEPDHPLLCETCKENAELVDPSSKSQCVCSEDYAMNDNECVPTIDPSVHFIFDSVDVQYSSGSFTLTAGASEPSPVPTMGYYFSGNDYLSMSGDLEDDSTRAVSMWVRFDEASTGTVYSEQDLSDTNKIDFQRQDEDTLNLTILFGDIPTELVGTGLDSSNWYKIAFVLAYSDNVSTMIIYINGHSKATNTVSSEYSITDPRFYIGGTPSGNGLKGYMLDFSVSFGFIDTYLRDPVDICVSPGFCDILIGDCDFPAFMNELEECESCQCENNQACARSTDCRLHIDQLCKTFSNMYECQECYPNAVLSGGTCKCIQYAEFNEENLQCQCIDGSSPADGICSRCGDAFSHSEIKARINEDFNKIYIEFAHEVEDLFTSCPDLLQTETLNKIGEDYRCTWESDFKLTIILGLNFDLQIDKIVLISTNFSKKYPQECDNMSEDLEIPVSSETTSLVPVIELQISDTYSIGCEGSLLVSGEGTLGLAGHPAIYKWSVSPTTAALTDYLKDIDASIVPISNDLLTANTYTFTLTVTNALGNSASGNHTISIFAHKELSVLFDCGSEVEIQASSSLLVLASVSFNCGAEGTTSYKWTYLEGDEIDSETIIERTMNQPHTLQIQSGDLLPGKTYKFRMIAKAGDLVGDSDLVIHVKNSDIVALIDKLSGTHKYTQDLILYGTASYDPDNSETVLNYEWYCQVGFEECLDSSNNPLTLENSPTITLKNLKLESVYKFQLKVTADSRETSAQVDIRVTDQNIIEKEYPAFAVSPHEPFIINEIPENGKSGGVQWTQVMGPSLNPITSKDQLFIKFSGDNLEHGTHYAWQIEYEDLEQTKVKSTYSWYTDEGADCLDSLEVFQSDIQELLVMNDCLTKEGNGQEYYYFGIIEYDKESPLYGPTKYNYAYLRLPAGTHKLFGAVCDDKLVCTKKTFSNYYIKDSVDLNSDEDLEEFFASDTSDPEAIPATVYYLVKQYQLSEKVISHLLSSLTDYMSSYIEYSRVKISVLVFVMTEFLTLQVKTSGHLVQALEGIEAMLDKSGSSLLSQDIQELYQSLDKILPSFADDPVVMNATQRTLQRIMVNYMKHSVPYESPSVFNVGKMYSTKSRSLASDFAGKSISIIDSIVNLPSSLPFEPTDVINIGLSVLELNTTNVIEVTFGVSGSLVEDILTLEEEVIVPLVDLEEQITIEIPIHSELKVPECVYLKDREWDTSGCEVISFSDSSALLKVSHTSMFTLREFSGNDECSLGAVLAGSVLVLVMFLHLIITMCTKNQAQLAPPQQFEMVVGEEKPKIDPQQGTDEHKFFEYATDKKSEIPTPAEIKKFSIKDIFRNHLLLGQCYANFLPTDQRALLLYIGLFICFLIAGAIHQFEDAFYDLSSYIIFGFTIGLVSVFFTGIVEFVIQCIGNTTRNILLYSLMVVTFVSSMYFAFFNCSNSTQEWIIVFAISAIADLVIYQTILSIIKTIFYRIS